MVRVVDFTRVLAGPWATQVLGDQGFDVIKIEALDGDETRHFLPLKDGESVYFACTNRNKRSIALDLKAPAGVDVARRLIATADVVVENFRPGVLSRLGLDPEHLCATFPRLIVASVSSFGEGEFGARAGYDLVRQCVGGIASLTGDPPQKAGPSIADLASAGVLVQAILFALLERHETGRGKRIDLSMFAVQHSLLAYYASAWLNAGRAPPAPSNAHPSIAPYNLYRCADGWLAICCANEANWKRLRHALELPDDPRWHGIKARVADRERLDARITEVLLTGKVAEWDTRLVQASVPCAPVLDVQQSLVHPAARQVNVGPWTFPAPPIGARMLRPPPRLGEHTDELLAELGLDPAPLRAAGVVY